MKSTLILILRIQSIQNKRSNNVETMYLLLFLKNKISKSIAFILQSSVNALV